MDFTRSKTKWVKIVERLNQAKTPAPIIAASTTSIAFFHILASPISGLG